MLMTWGDGPQGDLFGVVSGDGNVSRTGVRNEGMLGGDSATYGS